MPQYNFEIPLTLFVTLRAGTEADARTLLRYEAEELTDGLLLPDLSPRLRAACVVATDAELREAQLTGEVP